MKSIGKLAKDIGTKVLTILDMGRFFDVVMGSVVLTVAIANVILNVLLVPILALEEAVAADIAIMIIWNLLLAIRVHRKLGLILQP